MFIISLILIISAVSMLVQYSDEVAEQASVKASYYTLAARQEVERRLDENHRNAAIIAAKITEMTTQEELNEYLASLYHDDAFSDILFTRYFKDGVLHSSVGDEYTGTDPARAYREKYPDRIGYIGSYIDTTWGGDASTTMSVIGFYAPVSGSPLVDAVVIYYPQSKTTGFFDTSVKNPDARFSVLCNTSGDVLVGAETVDNARVLTALRGMIGNKEPIDQLEQLLMNAEDGTVPARISGEDYLISVGADADLLQDLCVVELYRVETLCASNFAFIDTIIGIFILFAVIAVCVICYLAIHRAMLKREYLNLETTSKKLNCLNRHGFEKEAHKILERNKTSYFAVIVIQLRHFKYVYETFGETETDKLLMHLRQVSHKTVQLEEVYGHIEDGQFLFLLHAKDRDALVERLRIHALLANRYRSAANFDVLLKYGIYEVDRNENVSLTQMIDFAAEANNTLTKPDEKNATMQFNFYDSEIRKVRLINEDMELRMESALQNGEFQVAYQPKYSLRNGRQDGCEALVRWYDPKTKKYNRPALFMALFESNGFVVKLDKYVFTKVCEYISYSVANGRPVFPVSVNVSRITAVQTDFIDYYSKVKRKFGISDGQLMIEFTESFAFENYETLSSIVDGLHKNGFKCSIDDFGCGYSSYRILKSLPMDEIKLDKFFLEKGFSEDRDHYIFKSIIDLAKQLGMKVTQEGVEEGKDVDLLRQLGCDVVQGYIYSRPLVLSDYIAFCTDTRSHNLKESYAGENISVTTE